MNKNAFDYLIVGQGLAGSVLSHFLINEGKKIIIIDHFNENSSSQVAAGLVNPVTGRRVVKSWMADSLIPFAENFYRSLENKFGEQFYNQIDVIEVIHTVKELNEWTSRIDEQGMNKYFKKKISEKLYIDKINSFQKLIRISSSAWMNIPLFIKLCNHVFKKSAFLINDIFDQSKLIIKKDHFEYGIYNCKKIIFCEGYKSIYNPLWDWLPFVPAKGEILLIVCKDLPEDFILLSGLFIIPVGNHHFRVGSTYEWNFLNEQPTEKGKIKLLTLLNNILKIPFEVIDHRAGIRPTVKDRRPLIGEHPDQKNIYIFNGFGTKGVQLTPFFADHFIKFLDNKVKLMEEIDIMRYYK